MHRMITMPQYKWSRRSWEGAQSQRRKPRFLCGHWNYHPTKLQFLMKAKNKFDDRLREYRKYKPAAKAASKSSLPSVTKIPMINVAKAIYCVTNDSRLMKPCLWENLKRYENSRPCDVSVQISKVEVRTNQGLHPLRYQNILDLLEWHIKGSLPQDIGWHT